MVEVERFWYPVGREPTLDSYGYLVDPLSSFGRSINADVAPLRELAAVPCLVLLGGPGAGKSTALRAQVKAAKSASGGSDHVLFADLKRYGSGTEIRQATFEHEQFRRWEKDGGLLQMFVDSLDEGLVNVATASSMLSGEVVERGLARDDFRIRIACRGAEWPEELEHALRLVWGDQVAIYQLAPLRAQDVAAIAGTDAENFMRAIESRGVVPLAVRPITLKLLLNLYRRNGEFPATQPELYLQGCRVLVDEQSDSRRSSGKTKAVSVEARLMTAERLAAVTVLSNHPTVWDGADLGDRLETSVSVGQLTGITQELIRGTKTNVDEPMVRDVLATPLFLAERNIRTWAHRTYAEFLAARYLLTRGLELSQISSLLAHPVDGRVVPQLEETAAWLAGMHVPFRAHVLATDPQVLVRSDVPPADDAERSAIVDALLDYHSRGEHLAPHAGEKLRLARLAHPGLAAQLLPYVRTPPSGTAKKTAGRLFAFELIEGCRESRLEDAAVEAALDEAEEVVVRVEAARVIAVIGTPAAKSRLRPLALASGTLVGDAQEELRGWALRAVWPAQATAEEVFAHLTVPSRRGHRSAYVEFVAHHLLRALRSEDLPQALAWVARLAQGRIPLPFRWSHVVAEVLTRAWDALPTTDPPPEASGELLRSLAAAVRARFEIFEAVGRPQAGGKATPLWTRDDPKRLHLLAALVADAAAGGPKGSGALIRVPVSRPPLALVSDIPWLIETLRSERNELRKQAWADVIWSVFPRHDPDPAYLQQLLEACKEEPTLNAVFSVILRPIPLRSEEADKLRERYLSERDAENEDRRHRDQPPRKPMPEVVREMLAAVQNGNPGAWWRVSHSLQWTAADEDPTFGPESDLTQLPGWEAADESTRARILAGAKEFLIAGDPIPSKPLSSDEVYLPAQEGYKALRLLRDRAPDVLASLPPVVWKRWAKAILEYPLHGDRRDHEAQLQLALAAYVAAPDEVLTALEELMDKDSRVDGREGYERRMRLCRDRRVTDFLLERARRPDVSPAVLEGLLIELSTRDAEAALTEARNRVSIPLPADMVGRERAAWSALWLMHHAPQGAWETVWPAVESDEEFGKQLIGLAARHTPRDPLSRPLHELEDEPPLLPRVSDAGMADLFLWIAKHYPPAADPPLGDWGRSDERDRVVRFRDGLLYALEHRATPGAVAAVERIAVTVKAEWMDHVVARARAAMRQSTWRSPEPEAILRLAADRRAQLAESGEQLIDAIAASLHRLVLNELQGRGLVELLWNEAPDKTWRPKEEDVLSRVVAAHLNRELAELGLVVNREVEVRRGEYTDIYVTAKPSGPAAVAKGAEPITVTIEAKGCWHDKLLDAMETQLRDRYLKDSTRRHGLYLVGWYNCALWDAAHRSKKNPPDWTLNEAQAHFDKQARDLSGKGVVLRAAVIDTALRGTPAEKSSDDTSTRKPKRRRGSITKPRKRGAGDAGTRR